MWIASPMPGMKHGQVLDNARKVRGEHEVGVLRQCAGRSHGFTEPEVKAGEDDSQRGAEEPIKFLWWLCQFRIG